MKVPSQRTKTNLGSVKSSEIFTQLVPSERVDTGYRKLDNEPRNSKEVQSFEILDMSSPSPIKLGKI